MNQSTQKSNINTQLDTEPWYKQGWPWALIAIPILTIIAGVITFIIASNTDDTLVQDDYYKKGLAINSNIERVELAQHFNLSAQVDIDISSKLISIKLASNNNQGKAPSANLNIYFSHPTLASKDQTFTLSQLSSNEFIAEIVNLESAYWHVKIEDNTQTWLLKSRWLYPDKKNILIDTTDI